jgi:transcriptional regulator with XRE-family HTH domain
MVEQQDTNKFGPQLRSLRNRLGLSQAALAEAMDLPGFRKTTISLLERGLHQPPNYHPEFYQRLVVVDGVTEEEAVNLLKTEDASPMWLIQEAGLKIVPINVRSKQTSLYVDGAQFKHKEAVIVSLMTDLEGLISKR